MSEREPEGAEQSLDLATIAADDLLLDALSRGAEAPEGDGLAAVLAAWRADLDADMPDGGFDDDLIRAETEHMIRAETATTAVSEGPAIDVGGIGGLTPPEALPAGRPRSSVRVPRSARFRRRVLQVAGATIAVAGLATGLVEGSQHAGPSSPLWSLTKVLYPERADVRAVEHTLDQARAAIKAGRYEEARQLIDRARTELARVADPSDAARLRADIEALLRELPSVGSPLPPAGTPGPTSQPGVPQPTATPGAPAPTGPGAGTAPPATTPSPSPTGILPLPLPLPTLNPTTLLPSLPGLPLPTGGVLG